jgi:AraC family transcriptional regulator
MDSRVSLELAYATPADPPAARLPRDWCGFSAEFVRLQGDTPFAFKSRGESHYLALHDISLRDGELRVDGLPLLRTRDLRDTITFVPRGCGIEGWSQPEQRANSFVAMYFDPEALREDLGERYASRQPAPFAYARNAALHGTLRKLEALVRAPVVDELHAESVCLLASLEVFGVLAENPGRLSDRQLGLVTDLVESRMAEPISLSDLAGIARLSRSHFSRAFKATTGENPHAFVERRRIARAMEMLAGSDLSVEAIAALVGYRGAPQFRRVFRALVGCSPLKYRSQRRLVRGSNDE